MVSTEMDVNALTQNVRAGNVRALARAVRFVDDQADGFVDVLKALYEHSHDAHVIGVTGTPGAGKSTLVDQLVKVYRASGRRVGVIAVDPTSPYTGGAILGDRIRMQRHFLDAGVFIRSLATRGHLGGVSRSAADVMRVIAAAGFDVVIVETVGVGQDELEVAGLADSTVVVVPPGLGDDIQAIKAGILEVADVFVVNKADRDGADTAVRDLEQMMMLGETLMRAAAKAPGHSAATVRPERDQQDGAWTVPVIKTVATSGSGVEMLVDALDGHAEFLRSGPEGGQRRAARREREFAAIFRDALYIQAIARLQDEYPSAQRDAREGGADPYTSCATLLEKLWGAS